MAETDRVSALADAFHEAALEPELWPSAMARLGDDFGGASGFVSTVVFSSVQRQIAAVRINQDLLGRYLTGYGTLEGNGVLRQLHAMAPGEIMTRRSLAPDDRAWEAHPIYRQFLRPAGLHDGVASSLMRDAEGFAGVGLYRGRDFEAEEVDRFRACLPHLRRALQVAVRLGTLQSRLRAALAVLDELVLGIVLADGAGRALHANTAAEAILAEADGLALGREGVLQGARSSDGAALARLVAGAARAASAGHGSGPCDGRATDGGGALSLPRPSGRSPLSVLVAPLRRAAAVAPAATMPSGASVVVFVSDPERRHRHPSAVIGRLHGLPRAEAELVAQLLAGRDLQGAAEAMSISVNTAKTLLQRTFERTGTHRQAELLALVLHGPAGLVTRGER